MVELATTDAFYTARPNLSIDGTADPILSIGLASLMVSENTDGLYRCEATFGNWGTANGEPDFLYFNRQLLEFGKNLVVEIGDGDAEAEIFNGYITAMEGRFPQQSPPEILVLAEDRLQDLRMIRRTRSFDNKSFADLVNDIANEHSLTADTDVSGPTHQLLTQVNQSDLAFLRQCARDVDAEIWIEGNTLHAEARSRRQTEELNFSYGQRLREFAVMADLAQQRTSIVVSGWDVQAKQAIASEATDSVIRNELANDTSGGELLQQKFGQRVDRLVHEMPLASDEAQHIADATYRRMARRFLSGQGVTEGDARIKVGTHVTLDGLGPMFNGTYYICEVTHSYDLKHGYRTFFQVERPGLGA